MGSIMSKLCCPELKAALEFPFSGLVQDEHGNVTVKLTPQRGVRVPCSYCPFCGHELGKPVEDWEEDGTSTPGRESYER